MTREIDGRIRMVVSDDGTRCAAECPHVVRAVGQGDCDECAAFTDILSFTDGANVRLPACIAAEQAAASVPSCEGAAWAIGDRVRHVAGWTGCVVALGRNGSLEVERDVIGSVWVVVDEDLTRLTPDAPHLDGGARALDASEALREARVQGMREAMDIVRVNACVDSARSDIWRAIEAVRKGER